ncbi:MAG: energy transducer TonB [Myxococcales bacterium]|nr:energy transducer TonB [Myxococcales bacterium]
MRTLGLILVGALCGTAAARKPYYRPPTADSEMLATQATTRLTQAIRARSISGITAVLGTQFTNNGLWFPDARCAARFERSGEIKGADVTAFAKCLATLELQVSTRKAAPRDGGLLTAKPGIEIELAFRGDTLRYIGFPLQTGADRAIPMLSAQALEALRTAGTTLLDAKVSAALDLELAKLRTPVLTSWIKVCLDPKGEIVKLVPTNSSSSVTSDAFLAAIQDWRFKPFTVRGTPQPACALALLAYPGAKAPAVEQYPSTNAPTSAITRTFDFDDEDLDIYGGLIGGPPPPPPPPPPAPPRSVPPAVLESLRLAGTKVIAADARTRADILAGGKTRVVAALKICLDDAGSVRSSAVMKSSGFPAYDRKLISETRGWVFRPYKVNGKATAVCTAYTFIYDATKTP